MRIANLTTDLNNAFTQINGLSATPGYESFSVSQLNGLNTTGDGNKTYVINMTSGFNFPTSAVNVTGDAGDVFVLRWDTDANFANGYQGAVTLNQSVGLKLNGQTSTNFINVAGDLNSSGGSGSFFNGYWLTTGDANRKTGSFSNAVFEGGWYTTSNDFIITSGSGGDHLGPPVGASGVPLPSAALGGLGIFGLLAAASRARRQNA